jgi:hypothetical protein
MSGYNVSVPHELGCEAALVRVQQFLDQVRHNYGDDLSDVSGQWSDNRLEFGFAARGLRVRGILLVEETRVHVAGPLPLAALFFRGRIEQQIRQELEKLLAGS